jgi:pyruvate,orthophosphate dikinase
MSWGVDRDLFDDVMIRFKRRHRVALKVQFTAEQMREMALEYRQLGEDHEVPYVDDLLGQLQQAVSLVMGSWDKEPARVFRRQMGLSDAWGTGVLVQRMVYGNLGPGSGSGVVFTRDPGAPSTGIELFGDFTACSQGEDVVGGLVHPLPISDAQRHRYSPHLGESLEARFPKIYGRLLSIADQLINDHGFEHQEIEFTFESEEADGLYLLQTRPMRLLRRPERPEFTDPESLEQALLGVGIGVGGGAMSGAVAFTAEDIEAVRAAEPDVDIILLRPDTVPEDIPLVLAVNGLLTARGGFTSHAAVTAKRLGKCCVVNCRELVVDEDARFARIGHHTLYPGDRLSIDGNRGTVHSGSHEVNPAGYAQRWR